MPVMRQQTEAGERRQYNNRREQVSAVNTATGRSRSMPVMRQQTGASEHQQYSRQEQISASNRTTTRNRSAAQTAFRPAEKNWLSLTPPIQQHTGICQYTTPYHSAEQRRARKGGARGGKAGFVTPSAFPPRKPAHAKVSLRKGKSSTAQSVPPLERNYPSEDTGSPPRSVRQTPDIVQYLVQFSHYFYQ